MAEIRTFGLKSVKMGPIAGDGGMGTTLTLLGDGNTLAGTARFEKQEDEEVVFNSEEKDDPMEVILKKGLTVLEFAIVDYTPATMVRVLGGTVNGVSGAWEAPDTAPDIEESFEFISQRDVKVEIVRAKVKGSIVWPLSKEELGQIVVKATIMSPTKANTPSYTVNKIA